MNSILMIIVAVVIILLVFIMFSLDDQEPGGEEEDMAMDRAGGPTDAELVPPATPAAALPPEKAAGAPTPVLPAPVAGKAAAAAQRGPVGSAARAFPRPEPSEAGSDEDLRYRLSLEDQVAPVTGIGIYSPVVAVVQIRFPETLTGDPGGLAKAVERAEKVLDPAKAPFPYQVSLLDQLSQLWLFGIDEDRDDAVFEAVVTAFNAITRFKKVLETDTVLFEAKARLAVGMATGEVARVTRGPLGPVSHVGKTVYLASTLAEAAGDFQVYLDEQMHRLSLPWFDFREWKPMKLRSPLAPVAFFELVGWNKKDEVFAFATSKEWAARRAVAVAFRYLDFDDMAPMLILLSDPDERVALETLATLAEIKDERALGVLKMILPEAKNSVLRGAIIKALGAIGREEVIPILLASTKDVHWQVRLEAARALYEISGRDALRHIEHMVADEDGAVRASIHEILFSCHRDDRQLSSLRDLLGDLSQRARKAAVEALVKLATRDSLMLVARSYFDQEPELRRFILRQLRDTRSPETYACFQYLFQNTEESGRPEIVTALRRAQLAG